MHRDCYCATEALAAGYETMRNVYLAIIATAIGVTLLSEQRHFGGNEQGSMLADLIGTPVEVISDKLQVGDPVEPPATISTR
jgi:hypothetical protein